MDNELPSYDQACPEKPINRSKQTANNPANETIESSDQSRPFNLESVLENHGDNNDNDRNCCCRYCNGEGRECCGWECCACLCVTVATIISVLGQIGQNTMATRNRTM